MELLFQHYDGILLTENIKIIENRLIYLNKTVSKLLC